MNLSPSEESLISLNFPAIGRYNNSGKSNFTARKRSCWKVMFSQVFVSRGGGYSTMHQMHHGIGHMGGYPLPLDIRPGTYHPPPPRSDVGPSPPSDIKRRT